MPEGDDEQENEISSELVCIGKDPGRYFKWLLKKAEGGDTDAADELLRGFCSHVQEGTPIPVPILNYLWMAFSQYLSGDLLIEKALLLTNPEGRPPNIEASNIVKVDKLQRAVATFHLFIKRDGLKKTAAKKKTCEAFKSLGLSVRTLERHDNEMHLIREWSLDTLEQMAQPPRPKAPIRRPRPKKSSDRKLRAKKSR